MGSWEKITKTRISFRESLLYRHIWPVTPWWPGKWNEWSMVQYSVRCLIKLEIQFSLPLLLTMMLHVTSARVKAIVSHEKKSRKLTKKEINFGLVKNEGHGRREKWVCFNSAEGFSFEISATEMYLMAGDCGNVTHLKTHCVAWPLLTRLQRSHGERERREGRGPG